MTITKLQPAAGRLTFTGLGPGNGDLYLWIDLDAFHVGQRSRGAWDTCEDGMLVSRCTSCGAPIEFISTPECEHTLAVLESLPIGVPALMRSPHAWPVRVERVDVFDLFGTPWQYVAGSTCMDKRRCR